MPLYVSFIRLSFYEALVQDRLLFLNADRILSVSLDSTTTTSSTVSWEVDEGVNVTSFSISYSNTNNTNCFSISREITGVLPDARSYILTSLEEGTEYSVTVTAVLSDLVTFSKSIVATTDLAGT